MIKKSLVVILCICVLATIFAGCSGTSNDSDNELHNLVTQATTEISQDVDSFKLSYSQSDSLNPYESKTLNNQIVQDLVFDSLFLLDEAFNAEPLIASGYNYTDKKTLVVTIPLGIKFSDGSDLTVNSVVNAFNEASVSPRWKNSLKAIENATAISETAVQFNLEYANPNAHNLLTFAIAKDGEDKKGYPIGSGRYRFNEGGGDVYIELNKKHKGFNPHFTKIKLVNITSSESIDNAINIGNISYAFRDLSEGSKTRISANKKAVNLNNLVYIGINGNTGITSNENVRRAISLAVDRDLIVKGAYQGYGKSATSVFNPSSRLGRRTVVFSSSADVAAAKQAIMQSGYDENDLKIDILLNENENRESAAKLIKQQLEAVGFKVSINKVSSKSYRYLVKRRAFDIYIGETKIPSDMGLNSFFSKNGATHYGIDLNDSKAKKAYNEYLNGDSEIGKFVLEFSQEMPFVPLLYRQGMICYSKSMHGDMQGYAGSYFDNIEDWYYN